MPKQRAAAEVWKADPEDHDFPAAHDYLSLLLTDDEATSVVGDLRGAQNVMRKAKDLVRASRLALLPADDPEVAKQLKRVAKGQKLSPVLLVRGRAQGDLPLIVADGYHRICASYHLSDDADIPCRIADLP